MIAVPTAIVLVGRVSAMTEARSVWTSQPSAAYCNYTEDVPTVKPDSVKMGWRSRLREKDAKVWECTVLMPC